MCQSRDLLIHVLQYYKIDSNFSINLQEINLPYMYAKNIRPNAKLKYRI